MFRVMHHTSRRPAGHTPNTSVRTGMRAAEKARETPCKYQEDLKPKTSFQKAIARKLSEYYE
jgi:hypothetical protein